MSNDDTRAMLRDAIAAWYRDANEGQAVLTGFYLVAKGTGFDDDGDALSHIAHEWDADIIDQLGLVEYARERVRDRMREEER